MVVDDAPIVDVRLSLLKDVLDPGDQKQSILSIRRPTPTTRAETEWALHLQCGALCLRMWWTRVITAADSLFLGVVTTPAAAAVLLLSLLRLSSGESLLVPPLRSSDRRSSILS